MQRERQRTRSVYPMITEKERLQQLEDESTMVVTTWVGDSP